MKRFFSSSNIIRKKLIKIHVQTRSGKNIHKYNKSKKIYIHKIKRSLIFFDYDKLVKFNGFSLCNMKK